MKKIALLMVIVLGIFCITGASVSSKTLKESGQASVYVLDPEGFTGFKGVSIIGVVFNLTSNTNENLRYAMIYFFIEAGCVVYPANIEETSRGPRFTLNQGDTPIQIPYDGKVSYEEFIKEIFQGIL